MIVRELAWKQDPRDRRLRNPHFAQRVPFNLDTATAIARAVEQRASEILGAAISVDVFPPVRMRPELWAQLCDDSLTFEVSAECGDLTFVILRKNAQRIVACALGETTSPQGDRILSPMETHVVERFVTELSSGLAAVCGAYGAPVRTWSPAARDAYCELRFSSPLQIVMGVALREKAAQAGPTISPDVLADCPVECSVQVGIAAFDIFTIAGLTPGDVLPLETKVGPYATLNVGPDPIAAGEGGALGDRTAFKVHELIT
jgi:flagellar motor switch/type III secretory pathway protein FliN